MAEGKNGVSLQIVKVANDASNNSVYEHYILTTVYTLL